MMAAGQTNRRSQACRSWSATPAAIELFRTPTLASLLLRRHCRLRCGHEGHPAHQLGPGEVGEHDFAFAIPSGAVKLERCSSKVVRTSVAAGLDSQLTRVGRRPHTDNVNPHP